jgi:hypothetical protein
VTLPTLESFGLTRRQALSAMALLTAGGYTLSGAIVETVRGASTSSGRFAAKSMQTREIRDENDNVAIDLPGGGGITVDLLNTADTSAAAQGEVLQKGSSGTDLTFGSVGGNVPNWQEDPNSAINGEGIQSQSISLANTYERVLVVVQEISNATGSPDQVVGVRINGNAGSSDYRTTDETGTELTGEASLRLTGTGQLDDGESTNGAFTIERAPFDRLAVQGPFGSGVASNTTATGRVNVNNSYPVSSIEIRGRQDTLDVIKARVYGWNGGL